MIKMYQKTPTKNYDDMVLLLMSVFVSPLFSQIYDAKLTVKAKESKNRHMHKNPFGNFVGFFFSRIQTIVYFSYALRNILSKTIRQRNKTHQEVIWGKKANIPK